MKRAILLVSFGTTHREQLTRAIESVMTSVRRAYPTDDVHLAFSSTFISNKLKAVYGKVIPTMEEMVAFYETQHYEEIIVQPLHLIAGKEFDKVRRLCEAYQGSAVMKLGEVLLRREVDVKTVVNMLHALYDEADTYLILLGHGTTHEANNMYDVVTEVIGVQQLAAQIATLETLQEVCINCVQEDNIIQQKIRIVPLMLVAGKHINEEVTRQQQAIKKATGRAIEVITRGLGESSEIHQIVINHIEASRKL